MDTFCFAGAFKQHEKKYVEEIEENQANRAKEPEETLSLYIAPTAGRRNVAVPCEYCQATDAHGRFCRHHSHLRIPTQHSPQADRDTDGATDDVGACSWDAEALSAEP